MIRRLKPAQQNLLSAVQHGRNQSVGLQHRAHPLPAAGPDTAGTGSGRVPAGRVQPGGSRVAGSWPGSGGPGPGVLDVLRRWVLFVLSRVPAGGHQLRSKPSRWVRTSTPPFWIRTKLLETNCSVFVSVWTAGGSDAAQSGSRLKVRMRTVFTDSQSRQLEALFRLTDYPAAEARAPLARGAGLSEETVRVSLVPTSQNENQVRFWWLSAFSWDEISTTNISKLFDFLNRSMMDRPVPAGSFHLASHDRKMERVDVILLFGAEPGR